MDEVRVLIAPCGLNCGGCPLHLAASNEAVRLEVAKWMGVPADKVVPCDGCRPSKGVISALGETAVCDTYSCAVNEKEVEFCYQCGDFPCLKLAPCSDRAQELPHNTKVYNLLMLQKLGVNDWVERYPRFLQQYLQGKKPRPGSDIQL
jgi:hypothetical protein